MARVVLHITEALGGGIHTAIYNYALISQEFSHEVFARVRAGQQTHDWPDSIRTIYFEGSLLGFLRSAGASIAEKQPDVVHLHSSYAGLLRAWIPKKTRVVYSPHCFAIERDSEHKIVLGIYRVLEAALARRHSTVIGVSPRELAIARELNRSGEKVLVPNFAERRVTTPRESSDGGGACHVVGVGRLSTQKDPIFFKNVAEILGRGYTFTWIGDGEPAMKEALIAAGVEVTGWLSPDEVASYLQRADLYLHTARWEGSPLSAIEAASAGCPVISRDIPSMESLRYVLGGASPREVAKVVEKFFCDESFSTEVACQTDAVVSENSLEIARSALVKVYGTVGDPAV
ncbi:glycosyltransferase [Gordonia sp. NPDC058843]|uniref:glycosyltransferase n=1 Tax=Gordonia sp. NPDC058843 TaxID=3346648 RepID=UPI0036D159AB